MRVQNVIFPMTAGDLVQSAGVVTWTDSGGFGTELEVRRVENVEMVEGTDRIRVTFDSMPGEEAVLEFKKDTPILVTDISRW